MTSEPPRTPGCYRNVRGTAHKKEELDSIRNEKENETAEITESKKFEMYYGKNNYEIIHNFIHRSTQARELPSFIFISINLMH